MAVKDKICRKSLSLIFVQISEHHGFGMSEIHSKTLANIFINNYCTAKCPRSTKEAKQKVLNYVRYISMLFVLRGGGSGFKKADFKVDIPKMQSLFTEFNFCIPSRDKLKSKQL